MCAKFGVGLNSKVCICQNLFSQQCEENMPPKKTMYLEKKVLTYLQTCGNFLDIPKTDSESPLGY